MRITLVITFIVLFSSCAMMPYQQWNQRLTVLEDQLVVQEKSSSAMALPDVFLYSGAVNATKEKEAAPYPELGKLSGSIDAIGTQVSSETAATLEKLETYRASKDENH